MDFQAHELYSTRSYGLEIDVFSHYNQITSTVIVHPMPKGLLEKNYVTLYQLTLFHCVSKYCS